MISHKKLSHIGSSIHNGQFTRQCLKYQNNNTVERERVREREREKEREGEREREKERERETKCVIYLKKDDKLSGACRQLRSFKKYISY